MLFLENVSLTRRNTFGIAANARFYAEPRTESELAGLLNSVTARNLLRLILGGGSNLVFSGDYAGLVIRYAGTGIHCYAEDTDHYYIEAGGGEPWHNFVQYTLSQDWYGAENLSLIPGTVGAAPIQNIGAYGVELTDILHSLTAVDLATGAAREFSHAECRFGYRESVFKQELRGLYLITRVRFRLLKRPAVKTAYGDITAELATRGISGTPTPQQLSDTIIAIRRRKLPDPAVIGNAGSFFKNPVVPTAQADDLRSRFPGIVAYPQADSTKLAAGWLIEQAGWKGRRIGPVGSYEKQALVLVNHGGARGEDVMAVAHAIQNAVQEKFGVQLEMEPQVY